MASSPQITNYTIGKGECYFKKTGDTTWRHLGNVPEFEFTPEVETLEHFSSMSGVKTKDRTVTLSKSGTLRVVMEEWTSRNLALVVLGDVSQDAAGREVIEIFSQTAISGKFLFKGTNDVGPRYQWEFNGVDFLPGSSINPIGEEWGQLEASGEIAAVAGSFGTITKIAEEGEEASEPLSEIEVGSE